MNNILHLASALLLVGVLTGCDRDGNTGNGANDPTDRFESDKVKKNADFYGRTSNGVTDTAAKETTTLNTIDTTAMDGKTH